MDDALTVTFWGVRGSYPVPGPTTVRYGGNTPCVEVHAGSHTIILDAGTGIIRLGREMARRAAESGNPIEATLLLSHVHHDHTQGFPFFVPAYIGSSKLYIFGPGIDERDLEEALGREIHPPSFPIALQEMHALKVFRTLRETEVILIGEAVGGVSVRNRYHEPVAHDPALVCIRALRSYAHPGNTMIYRIEYGGRSLVYATDVEGYASADRRLIDFARGADLLIHDAQYTEEHYLGQRPSAPATQGWGHSTAAMACDVAQAAGAGQLVLFHHEPQYDDETIASIEAQARERFPNSISAYEGLKLRLDRRTVDVPDTGDPPGAQQPGDESEHLAAA